MYKRALSILKNTFGYDSFRGEQAAIIKHIAEGKDALVLMPTGGGKSICFQIPALLREGVAVVVSPLIALMQDQVDTLNELGVKAAALNSSLSAEEQRTIARQLLAGEIKFLYVAPERLVQERMINFLQQLPLALFAIDEAHCVSQWGHDFRPEYLQLGQLAELFPNVPRIALTATADTRTQQEIVERLHLKNAKIFIASFNRPNIFYRIQPKEQPRKQLLNFLADKRDEAGIIYCMSRKRVEDTAEFLQSQGYNALPYHAGLSSELRSTNQSRFIKEEGIIMVATIAFGMGIDKPNVRFVAHLDLPKSLEAYYQETGRAGRDGLPAEAWMVYGLQDVLFNQQLLAQSDASEQHKRVELHKLQTMLALCEEIRCRRQSLLAYFDEQLPEPCGYCDNCRDNVETWDATEAARKALSTVYRTGQRYGVGHLVDVLLGHNTEKVTALGHQHLTVFAIGKQYSEKTWRTLFRQLIVRGLVEIDLDGFSGLRLTEQCRTVLRREEKLQLRVDQTQTKSDKPRTVIHHIQEGEKELWEALRTLRRKLAEEHNVPPYVIFHDATLLEMLRLKPRTLGDMAMINGIGTHKLENYGAVFLEVINGQAVTDSRAQDIQYEIIALARAGMTVQQIAQQLSCSSKAVYRTLAEAISQQQLSLEQAIDLPEDLLEKIQTSFLEEEGKLASVPKVYKQLGGQVDEGVLYCVHSALADIFQ
ncbi:DNA helicase RecQ [Entomomonas asaccharolytica]|uniref:DNA helicase RecQ n=1 Tax=Entomomonas asaccharolytica TaxID=2785331 RepID=A0A974NDZ6_9GAMM|nr:DNA helicase RecQ [Entomomonas asaccharolytica]QQP84865.1 DNA helicase RecQ [Entomomonas asaccharolytica]